MTNENLVLWLRRHGACKAALDWLGDRDPAPAWEECESPEWMIWACDHAGIPDSTMRLLACRLVRETQMGDGRMVWDLLGRSWWSSWGRVAVGGGWWLVVGEMKGRKVYDG